MAQRSINNQYDLLLIGGSAGSLEVLMKLLPSLRRDLDLSVVVVMHRKNGESLLTDILSDKTSWIVKEAEDKDLIEPCTIYLAPADYHLLVEKDKSLSLDYSEKIHYSRPAIDVTFETAAEAYGGNLVAVLLSGANADGAAGLQKIKAAGGLTIVQNPAEASVSYMPQQAIDSTKVDYIVDTAQIIQVINSLNQ